MNPNQMQQQAAQQPPPGQSSDLNPTALAAMMAQAMAANMPQQQVQQQQLTPEQIAELRGTYNPDQQLIDLMFGETANPQTRMQALASMVEGIRYNAMKEAEIMVQHMGRQMLDHLREPLEDARSYGKDRMFTKLYEGHEGLRQFDPVIRGTIQQLEQQQGWPMDRDQRVEYARKHYIDMLKAANPQFDPTQAPAQHNPLPHSHAFGQDYRPSPQQSPNTQQQQPRPTQQPQTASLPSLGGGGGGAAVGASASNGSVPWATTLGDGSIAAF